MNNNKVKPFFHVVLHEPEIPPNTGNIIRLCANVGAALHLIRPFGFQLMDRQLKRAGLDYYKHIQIYEYDDYTHFINLVNPKSIFAIETSGERLYTEPQFKLGDMFLFGAETHGLSGDVLDQLPEANVLCIPMQSNIRSINLSNAVAIVLYEAWSQVGFAKF